MKFKGSGLQCVENTLAAIVQNTFTWIPKKEVQFLTVEDLPPTIENYAISYGNAFFGTVKDMPTSTAEDSIISLKQAVKNLDQATGANLMMGNSPLTYATTIFKEKDNTI